MVRLVGVVRALIALVFVCVGSGCAPGPTWAADARPVVEQSCVACHDGRGHPPSFVTINDVVAHGDAMRAAVASGQMPPFVVERDGSCGTFLGPTAPSATALESFGAWLDAGAPRGDDVADVALPDVASITGDRTSIPSYVPRGDATLPHDDHRCFLLKPSTSARYLTSLSAELESSSDAALHHVLLFALAHDGDAAFAQALDDADEGPGWSCPGPTGIAGATIAAVWAPGAPTTRFPEGTGVDVSARALVVQVHVAVASEPSPVDVTLHIGRADTVSVPIEVRTASTANFVLPPHQASVSHAAQLTPTESDVDVLAMFPHMHRAGVSLRLSRADGTCLLDVPRWRYTSQELVHPQAPPSLAAREPLTLDCEWQTLDRDAEIHFGESTRDEMCSVFLFVARRDR